MLDGNNCTCQEREAVRRSLESALVSVSSFPSPFLFLCSDSSGALCFQGTSVSVCTCPLPGLWSLPIMKGDILFPAILKHRRKAFWSQLSNLQISVVLWAWYPILRTLDSDICPCVTNTFEGFFVVVFLSCSELCVYIHIQPRQRARLWVLSCVLILGLPLLSPFLMCIIDSNGLFTQAEVCAKRRGISFEEILWLYPSNIFNPW